MFSEEGHVHSKYISNQAVPSTSITSINNQRHFSESKLYAHILFLSVLVLIYMAVHMNILKLFHMENKNWILLMLY